jgi:N-acetylglucosaminyl-diphospho-decaprenol L-rhamnosyltransferase
MPPMDLSIIFVNWNSLEYLQGSIASIYENTEGASLEIVVVDNASPEEGVETLLQKFPAVKLIKSSTNLGFSRANNLGFKQSCGECVLFLNPDTKLVGPAISTMLRRLKTLPDAGIVGCKLLNGDLSISTTSIQKFPTILNQLLSIESLRLRWPGFPLWDLSPLFCENANPTPVEVIPGACMLLRRRVFEQAGMFSEEFFMYAEDLDLNHKVKALALTNYYVGDATVVHYGGKSSSRQKVNQWATMMKYRAMLQLFRKTRGRFYGALYRIAIGSSAIVRLTALGLALVFLDRDSLRSAAEKWTAALRWSVGLHDIGLGHR